MAHDVFISYSNKDKPVADAICSIFENNGIRCWVAPRDILPGMDWGASIIDAINGSHVMVLVLSSNSNASDQVKREVERAVHKSIIIIPFRIEDVQLSKSLEYQLSLTHWMDAITPPLEKHIQLLANEIKPLLLVRQTDTSLEERQSFSQEKVSLEKQKKFHQDTKVAKDSPDAIETYFYDLGKEKRISKDILLAVLALLDKEPSQLSALEQQQYTLINDLFASKFSALDFVRKWDKLAYEIEHAEKTAQNLREKERLEQEKLINQKQEQFSKDRFEQEKTLQEKRQREQDRENFKDENLEQKQTRNKFLIGIAALFLIGVVMLIVGLVWDEYFQDSSDSSTYSNDNVTEPVSETATVATEATTAEEKKNFNIEMIDIKGGCFSMGSPTNELGRYNNEMQHRVCVQDFQLGKYEVTQALWQAVMGINPSKFKGDNLPVEQVSWDDVQTFLTRLNQNSGENYRLPTEAEWEYAARAGTTSLFYTGLCINTTQANYNGTEKDYAGCGTKTGVRVGQTTAVGSYPANPWGLYDMAGNVWEWMCSEYVENYDGHEIKCSDSTSNTLRVLRSGGWAYGSNGVRPAIRWWSNKNESSQYIGFRLAKGDKFLAAESEIPPATTTTTTTTSTSTSSSSQSSRALWASLAIDSNQGTAYGYSYNYPTAVEADARALKECGSSCYIVKNFNGGCGAFAADQASGSTAGGWGIAPTKEKAQEIALKYCRESGGKDCIVRVWSCNSR